VSQNTTVVIVEGGNGVNLLVRVIWFLLVGWWAAGVVSLLGWLLLLPVVTIPLGLAMLNAVPKIATLKEPKTTWQVNRVEGVTVVNRGAVAVAQHPFWMRAAWFVVIGWWLTGLVLAMAYVFAVLPFFWPLACVLYDRVPVLLTLRRT